MASNPITSWKIDGETKDIVRDFISWAPKSLQMVTAAMTSKKCLFLGRKTLTNLDSMLKSKDIPLPTNVCLFKAMLFPVLMNGCQKVKVSHTVVSNSF